MLRATWLERDEAKAELDSCMLRVCCSDVGAARGFFLSILHLSLPSLSPSFPCPFLFYSLLPFFTSVPPHPLASTLLIFFVFSCPPGRDLSSLQP